MCCDSLDAETETARKRGCVMKEYTNDDLKPCPFCKGTRLSARQYDTCFIVCDTCDCYGPGVKNTMQSNENFNNSAIAWNKRN
jgi:Restriction alleviation protein Lar